MHSITCDFQPTQLFIVSIYTMQRDVRFDLAAVEQQSLSEKRSNVIHLNNAILKNR